MVELKTAEATTKYLRSKDIKPTEAVKTAESLLDGSLDVFLINKHHFVFDLICDRMNEFTGKDFKVWKLEASLWRLWQNVWQLMGQLALDLDLRSRSFRRVKLVSIVTSVIEQSIDSDREELLEAMFSCVGAILASGYIEVEEYTVTGLLAAYAAWLEKLQQTTSSVNEWTSVVIQLFELPRQSSNYKPTKKSTARYFTEVLPHLLNFLSSEPDSSLKPTHDLLSQQNRTFLFEVETARTLTSHMDDVIAYDGLTDAAVEYLFHEVISSLAATDIASCESVFVSITKSSKFSQLSETLLQFLAKVNRTLSTDFFEQLYTAEMARKPIRWGLVGHIVSLNPELAQLKAEQLVKDSKDLKKEEVTIIASSLAKGYIRARDFDKFIGEVYSSALPVNNEWASEAVVDILSAHCGELSSNQMSSLIQTSLANKEKEKTVLLLRGLLMSSTAKQDAAAKVISANDFIHQGWSEIVYYLLCIYDDELLSDDLVKKVVPGSPKSKFDHYLTFRVAELTGDIKDLKEKHIEKFVKKLSVSDAFAFAKRWLVLIELFKTVTTALFLKMLESTEEDEFVRFFETEATLVYELPGLLEALSTFISKNSKFPYKKELFCMMPHTIYRRFFSSFTDEICKDALKNEDAKVILKHILREANGSSMLEKDFDFYKKFIGSDDSQITIDTAQLAWNGHINRFKDQASSDFVHKVLKHLIKTLKKKPSSSDFRLCQVVLNGKRPSDADFEKAFDEICNSYVSLVAKVPEPSNEQLSVLANLPSPLNDKVREQIKALLKSTGKKTLDTTTETSLFVMAAKTSTPGLQGALFLSSLYLALQRRIGSSSEEALLENLSAFFKGLPREDFHQLYLHLLASCEDAAPPFLDHLIRILSVLAKQLNKDHQKEHTTLFVGTILIISLRLEDIQAVETLTGFLSTLTTMLSDHVWIFSQYAVELTLATVGVVLKKSQHRNQSMVFNAAVNLLSYIVLFHRFRLTSRYHLLVNVLVEAMKHLTRKEVTDEDGTIVGRILVTLSEPPVQRSTKENDSLTSQAAVYKRAIRKQAHVLLINYVHMQVSSPLKSSVTDALTPGIYSVFGLLSKVELQLANQLLDLLGKVYFKNLYQSYKDHGKWKN